MRKTIFNLAALTIIAVFLIWLSSAAFEYGSNNLETEYVSGDIIRGTVSLSFLNEPTDSLVASNFNGSIRLVDLLAENGFEEGRDYNCSKQGCSTDYAASGSISSISLEENKQQLAGFKITGKEVYITSIKFSLASNIGKSCTSQILIDMLDKNETFIQNYKNTGFACGGSGYFGCFDKNAANSWADLVTAQYCEKIHLPAAAAYKIGAIIKTDSVTNSKLNMELKNSDWLSIGTCELPSQTSETEQIECAINYSAKEQQDFYVCINSENENSGRQIRIEQEGENCGTDTEGSSYNLDYEIFARPVEFDSVGTITINESTFSEQNNGQSIADYVNDYLEEKYEGNCTKGCIIPFRLSGLAQELTFSNAEIKYTQEGGSTPYTSTGLFKVEKNPSTITSDELEIDVEKAGFRIPIDSKSTKLYLYIGGESVLPNPLPIIITRGFDFNVIPEKVFIGEKTTFSALTSENITSSKWDFGDGTTKTAAGSIVSHRYLKPENGFNVRVELTRKDGVKTARTFNITSLSFNESATKMIAEYERRLDALRSSLNSLAPTTASEIKKAINLDMLNNTLKLIKAKMNNASADYAAIIRELSALDIPSSVSVKESAKGVPILIGYSNMDVGYIEELSNQQIANAADREKAKQAITAWLNANYEASIDYDVITKTSELEEPKEEILLTKFKIDIVPKESSAKSAYLIIGRAENSLSFLQNYSEQQIGSGTYIPISGAKTVEFTIADDTKVQELGAYISPSLSEVYSEVGKTGPSGFQWKKFIIWMVIVLVAAFIAYIAMQEWYKKRYESHLFKNQNDLYNLITFIYNSRKKGLPDDEIKKKLKESGWSGERIDYAFKKVDGRRTGMWEIPIFRSFEQKKIESEIAKRQPGMQNAGQKPL